MVVPMITRFKVLWLLILFSIFSIFSVSTVAALPEGYTAKYRLISNGLRLGETVQTLSRAAPDQPYQFETKAKAVGLALLFIRKIEEQSRWRWQDGMIQPLEYRYEKVYGKPSKTPKNRHIRFDWTNQTATATENGKTAVIRRLRPGTLDDASIQLALMHDLEAGKERFSYTIPKKDRWRTIHLREGRKTEISVPAGKYMTRHFERVNISSGRVMQFWLAPELHHLPVQIEYEEKDGMSFQLQLENVTWQ